MEAREIEGDKHNVVYICEARLWGKRGRPTYTRPTIHGSRWSRFCVARVSGGVIERCEGECSVDCGESFEGCVTGHANV